MQVTSQNHLYKIENPPEKNRIWTFYLTLALDISFWVEDEYLDYQVVTVMREMFWSNQKRKKIPKHLWHSLRKEVLQMMSLNCMNSQTYCSNFWVKYSIHANSVLHLYFSSVTRGFTLQMEHWWIEALV